MSWLDQFFTGVLQAVQATAPIVSSGGATPTLSITPASSSAAGSMSAADKVKLDALPTAPVAGSVSGAGTTVVASIPYTTGTFIAPKVTLVGQVVLVTPGILIPVLLEAPVFCAKYGTTMFVGVLVDDNESTFGDGAWFAGIVSAALVAGNLVISVNAPTPTPFVTTHAYLGPDGGFDGAPPNAIGGGDLVTNGGNLYIVGIGGTDSGSSGPTGTSAGPITAGGLTYYYVGPASAGVTLTYTFRLG